MTKENIKRITSFIFVVLLVITTFANMPCFGNVKIAQSKSKERLYRVYEYDIKNISISKSKLKITTYESKQMTYTNKSADHINHEKGKKFTFKMNKDANIFVVYYLNDRMKTISYKKLKKLMKISKKYIEDYKFEAENYDETEGHPELDIMTDSKGNVELIAYREGKFDVLSY